MKLIRKSLAMLLVLAMAIAFVACGQEGQQSTSSPTAAPASSTPSASTGSSTDPGTTDKKVDPLKIRLYNPVPGPVIDKVLADFSSIVSEKSGGAITCEITPAGTLGAEREATQLMLMGDLDMAVFSIDALDWLVPNIGMSWVCLPGLLNSWEEVDNLYNNGWMFEHHKKVAAENGIDLICPGEFGLKVLLGTGKAPKSMADLKGLKVRVPDVNFHHAYFTKLGMIPVSGIDMYTGLQQKTMEMVHNNIPASSIFKLEEVVDWILLTWDLYGTNYWIANGDFSAKWTDAQREIITDACLETAQYIRNTYRELCDTWLDMCRQDPSIEVIEPTDEMKAEFKRIGREVWKEYRDLFDKEAMDRIFKDFNVE
ncbi:MAG TPA: TRAP transporter substrate-binding protein [Thermoclostridium sp.]|nr:TRAP transporter substrate-binding protein [Thermoclostridium sp.]HPU45352.1 TRAP transporter substrate-binding protein [Thermoclostridium sp.]